MGNISVRHVIGKIKQQLNIKDVSPFRMVSKLVDRIRRRRDYRKGIRIKDMDSVVTHLAKCCFPIPGDSVIGYITRGKGITIHRYDCKHIISADPVRLIDITWETADEETYPVRLVVLSVNKVGMLADISAAIARKKANIVNAKIESTNDNKGIAFFTVEVKNLDHLTEVIKSIKSIKDIISARRV